MRRRFALVAVLAVLVSGCGIVTGRPFSAWSSDKALVATVKSAIVAVRLRNLTHVNVDVYEGVVYLSGTVRDGESKARTEEAARGVEGVRQVVSQLIPRDDAGTPTSALPAAVTSRPVPSVLRGVVRLEGNRAYDAGGHVVATVYVIGMTELAQASTNRFTADHPVDHVTIHAMEADADVPLPHYLMVLWRDPEAGPPR